MLREIQRVLRVYYSRIHRIRLLWNLRQSSHGRSVWCHDTEKIRRETIMLGRFNLQPIPGGSQR